MSVSRPLQKPPTNLLPAAGGDLALPPFWELEDLLATGLDCEAALQVMAARRGALMLIDTKDGAERPSAQPAERRFRLFF